MWARQYNLRRALSAGSIERDIRMRRNVHSLKLALVLLIALAVPRASHAEVDEATPRAAMSTRETTELTRWLEANELNEFGDPKDTMYTGGTPLFDESTGESRDRYEYIAARHPDAPWKKDSQPKMVDVDEKIEASRFPERWGPEPVMQTRDYRELPGGYGFGSGTLAKWIEANMAKDAEAGVEVEDLDETGETLGAAPGPAPNLSSSPEDDL